MSSLPDRFDVTTTDNQPTRTPKLSVYQSGSGHINASAIRAFFDGEAEAFLIGTDVESGEMAFVAADSDLDRSYAFSTDTNGVGGDISIGTALSDLGIDADDVEETQYFPLEREGQAVVADLSELQPTESDESASSGPDEGTLPLRETLDIDMGQGRKAKVRDALDQLLGDSDAVEFDMSTFASAIDEDSRGMNQTIGGIDGLSYEVEARDDRPNLWRVFRDSDGDDGDEADGESTDANADERAERETEALEDGDPTESVVRDCAGSVDSIQELAELLDVTEGKARALAHDAGVDDGLKDLISRPGVDR